MPGQAGRSRRGHDELRACVERRKVVCIDCASFGAATFAQIEMGQVNGQVERTLCCFSAIRTFHVPDCDPGGFGADAVMKLLCGSKARGCAALVSRGMLQGTLLAGLAAPTVYAAADDPWALAGQQGMVRSIIVPMHQARDREAYTRQIRLLCEPDRTCFLNFYTNSSAAPLAMPLPDVISNESTAVFRRSMKQGGEIFRWNCRLQMPTEDCF